MLYLQVVFGNVRFPRRLEISISHLQCKILPHTCVISPGEKIQLCYNVSWFSHFFNSEAKNLPLEHAPKFPPLPPAASPMTLRITARKAKEEEVLLPLVRRVNDRGLEFEIPSSIHCYGKEVQLSLSAPYATHTRELFTYIGQTHTCPLEKIPVDVWTVIVKQYEKSYSFNIFF